MKATYLPQIDLQWKQIDTVFLDMDGTLLDLHFDNHFWLEHLPRRYAEIKQIDLAQAHQYLNQRHEQTHGTLAWYCLDDWQQFLQVDLVQLKQEVAEKIQLRAQVERFLTYLREMGKRVVLLTNAHAKSLQLKFSYIDLSRHFDRVILSHDLHLPKEHPAFWTKLSTLEVFDRERSLFIDDNLQVLRAAQAYGVAHLLAIAQPDSQQATKEIVEFTVLHCYSQLMPTV